MIILIGGVGCTGKTYIAQKLLERYKYSSLSIDHLKMGLYRADCGCGFTPTDDAEVIGDRLWPILKGMVLTCIENEQNLIVEGCYLHPEKIREIEASYPEHILSFYLGFSPSYIEKYFDSRICKYRSVIEKRKYECEDTAESYARETMKQKELCMKNNAMYFEIHDDYEEEIQSVFTWIDDELARKQSSG